MIKYIFGYICYGISILSLLASATSIYIGFTAEPPSEEFLAGECRQNVATGIYSDFASCMEDALLASGGTDAVAGLLAAFAVFMALVFYVIGRLIIGKKKVAKVGV